jgi:hypothetical protein
MTRSITGLLALALIALAGCSGSSGPLPGYIEWDSIFVGYLSTGIGIQNDDPSWFDEAGGTSQAAPHVAALAAMVLKYSDLSSQPFTAAQLKAHILSTARNTVWSGGGLGNNTQPIVDFDNSLPWIDVTSPSYNQNDPAWGQPPTLVAQEIIAHLHIADGLDEQADCRVTFYMKLTGPGYVDFDIPIGEDSTFEDDESYQSMRASCQVNPGDWPFFHGPATIWATIDNDDIPAKVRSQGVQVILP